MKSLIALLISTTLPLLAQEAKSGPASHHTLVEIKGTIKQVNIEQGAGMPSLDVETAKGPVKLVLGSMRYLMQNDFSPKAGEAITARAFQEETQALAKSIELPASGKSLKLRDDEGKPLWRGSMGRMKGMGGNMQGMRGNMNGMGGRMKGMQGMSCKDCKAMPGSKGAAK